MKTELSSASPSQDPGQVARSAGVGSTGALLPTALQDRGSLALSWQPMKLAS